MVKIPFAVWIANAAARLAGHYGDVTRQAEAADCSRQTVYDHTQKVQAAVELEHAGGPTHAQLIQENEHLRQENARLWDWLAQTIEFPLGKRHEFTVTATAMGLSLNQVLVLLAIIMGTQARPGRSTIQRWIKGAGQKATRVLKHLDRRCRTLVLVGCLDRDLLPGPSRVGRRRAGQHDLVPRAQGRRSDGRHMVPALAGMDRAALRARRRRHGFTGRHRAGPAPAPRGSADPAGERPGRVPHDPGGPAGREPDLEPGGDTLGGGRGRDPPSGAGAASQG